MLKIGEFSKIAQVSVKTLRYYDEVGLIKPAYIDRYNGYRYYTINQLVPLNRILALKDLDFSLDQIKSLLHSDLSNRSLQYMLKSKVTELQNRVSDEQSRLLRVENRLSQLQISDNLPLNPVLIKPAPDQRVATIRQVIPTIAMLPEWQEEQLEKISIFLKPGKETASECQIMIYHQDEYQDTDLDVEVGMIIGDAKNTASGQVDTGLIRVYTLNSVSQMATTIYSPETSTPSEVYAHLAKWTQINGFRPAGSWRELKYQQDKPDENQIIEIQRPIIHTNQYYQEMEMIQMEPKIKTYPSFTLVGLRYFGRNENQEISQLWEQFNQKMRLIGGIKNETGEVAIGLCITPEFLSPDGSFEYVAGLPVSKVEDVPQGFVVREVPEYTYAVFAHTGDLEGLGKTYEYIYETWLPQSGYQLAAKLDFEYYDDDFKNFSSDSIFYIYVPIENAR
jgi:predicted transcriptional regulator YdeE/DNA-binding transcriptional MerR regulator